MAAYLTAQNIVLRETDAYLTLEARQIVSNASESNGKQSIGELREALDAVQGVTLRSQALPGFILFEPMYGRVIDPRSHRVTGLSPNLARRSYIVSTMDDVLRHSPPSGIHLVFAGPDEERMMRTLTRPIVVDGQTMILQLAVPWDDNEDAVERFGLFLGLSIAAILFVSALGSWVVVGRTLRPIGRIVAEVERADIRSVSGALLPAPSETDSEVGRLVATLNGMAARMHRAFDTQRRFAADASHELRTPLTFLRGEIEYTLLRPREAETYKIALENAVTAIDELGRIVESLSYLARLDSGETAMPGTSSLVDVGSIIVTLVDEQMPEARRKSIDLSHVENDDTVLVRGHEEQIRLMLRNLLQNAIKYTPEGGRVSATTAIEHREGLEEVEIRIADTGIGIAGDEIEHVFERFWRADRTRSTQPDRTSAAGTGLGLSIAGQIAEAHGGAIDVVSEVGVGSTFTVRLPSAARSK